MCGAAAVLPIQPFLSDAHASLSLIEGIKTSLGAYSAAEDSEANQIKAHADEKIASLRDSMRLMASAPSVTFPIVTILAYANYLELESEEEHALLVAEGLRRLAKHMSGV